MAHRVAVSLYMHRFGLVGEEDQSSYRVNVPRQQEKVAGKAVLLIKTATSATFVVMI